MPLSEVDVWESPPGSSQFTHVTLAPDLIDSCSGTYAKFLIMTTTVPAAGEEMGIRQSPV